MGLKLVFLTPEEPTIIPPFFERVLPVLADRVSAVAVVSPIYKNSTWVSQGARFVRSFGLVDFAAEAGEYVTNKVLDLLKRTTGIGGFHSIRTLARHYGIPLYQAEDVNGTAFL